MAQPTNFRAIPTRSARPIERVGNRLHRKLTGDKEIRLLILEPGAREDGLECQLVNAELSRSTRFEALSYAWGDHTVKYPLKCSGQDICVWANLHDALLDLRHLTRKRTLWIDALCINQTDNDEKSKQIRLMHEIYSQAEEVLIYLGRSDPSVHGAIESMRWLNWKFMPLYGRQFLLSSIFGIASSFIEDWTNWRLVIKTDTAFSWDPIINLLGRPWFQRTWVIQEAVIAHHGQVTCGDQSICWTTFLRVVDAIKHYQSSVKTIPGYHSIYDTISGLGLMRSARSARHPRIYTLTQSLYRPLLASRPIEGQEDSSLLNLILMSRRYKCTYPHDKIFGMLGVAEEDTSSELLKPDYNISSMDAYRNFVLWEIKNNKSLRVLGTSSVRTIQHCSWPSWVPDFNTLDPIESLTGPLFSGSRADASAGRPMEVRESSDGTELHIRGCVVDTIHTVGKQPFKDRSTRFSKRHQEDERVSVYDQLQINRGMIEEARNIWLEATQAEDHIFDTMMNEGTPLPTISPGWVPFLRVLFGDISVGDRSSMIVKEVYTSFLRLTLAEDLLPKQCIKGEEAFAIKALGFFAAIARSRRFARTDMGLVGYVPMRARRGDLVVVLYGSKSSNAAIGSSAEQAFVSLHQETTARSVQNISSH
ncbi:heterokaryon incompatibility 6 OR allele [Fusarium mexicanum]|uniref:Heterokaryon incompatibility 6 OR allele n=1 Tax=Fusarium mexicanum TaxID=751941 RepID=A0A8H5MK79_9HYPO|nr:heterokaryon incompatibility 6 OR allele [Fusarium mexicanum]